MSASSSRNIAKLFSASLLGAAMALAASTGAFASVMPPLDEAARVAAAPMTPKKKSTVSSTQALAKEQQMSAGELISRWAPYVKEASRRFGVSADWVRAVIRMESGGRTLSDDNQPITSSAGAMGIMQVMPETYRDMRQQHGLGADPHDPRDNILAGTAYLRWLHEKYGYPKMFAAYNAGPGTLEAQISGARKLPKETRTYVKRISHILGIDPPPSDSNPPQPVKVIATLTRPGGTTVTIDGDTVDKIRAAFPNEFVPGVRTVVIMGQRMQGVLEDVATVTSALKGPARLAHTYLPQIP
jgi:membrane-bound lytic murein transglycosylase B